MEQEGTRNQDAKKLYLHAQNGTVNFKGKPATKKRTGKWLAAFPMLVMETAATIIFFALVSNMLSYMTGVLHRGVAESAQDVTTWTGTLLVSSVVGAFMSDTYWGRYKTLLYAALLYCLGLALLTVSTSIKSFRPPSCAAQDFTCKRATTGQYAFFMLSLYFIALANGSTQAIVMAFGADQFDEADDSERQKKYSFFNWVQWSIHMGGLISVTLVVYIEDHVGWGWGFGGLLSVVFLATALFVIQTPRYRYRAPEGSPLTKIAQVLVAAFRNRRLPSTGQLHEDTYVPQGKRLVPHTNQFLFLDKAAVVVDDADDNGRRKDASPWKLSTVTRVEEVKLVMRLIPVWLATLWFSTAPTQTGTFFLRQGMTMNNHLGSFRVPPASMLLFNNLGNLLFIPFYDHIMIPALRKVTKKDRGITLLQRIGVGLSLSVVALVVAAVVEIKRKNSEQQLSIFWMVPQFFILGIAEALANIGVVEFFHDQAPDTFHSLGISLALTNVGTGAFLSTALTSSVNKARPTWLQNDVDKGHLDYFYWLVAALTVLNLLIYIPVAWWYSYKTAEDYVETV